MKIRATPIWIFTLSTYVGLFICRFIFDRSTFLLHNFSDRTIGIAVLKGVDIAARSVSYIKLVSIFSISFLISFYIISSVWRLALKRVGSKDLRKDGMMLLTLSSISIFTLIYHYVNGAEIIVGILDILKVFIALVFAILIAKIIFKKNDLVFFNLINNYNIVVLSFLLPFVIFFIRWVLISGSFIFTNIFFVFFILLWVSFWLILGIYFHFVPKKNHSQNIASILSAAIPLLLIPISIPIINELQYSLSSTIDWSIKRFSILGVIFWLICSLIILIFYRVRNIKLKFAKYLFFPIFIATITLFNLHTNFLDINFFDTFHHGENLISTQQLFMFGKIPFINLYPTHGISYILGQTLYSLTNEYQPFAPWLWEWIAKIFEVVLLYFVLSKITNSFFSATIITFLPIIGIFGGQALIYGYSKSLPTTYYLTPLLVGLTLIWSLKKPTFKKMLVLWITCLFLIVWRVDFGIAGLVSTCFILIMSIVDKYIKKKKFLTSIIIFAKSTIVSMVIGIIIFISICLAKNESFSGIFLQIFEFIKFQGQAQGLLNVISSYSPISIFQYLVLPGAGIFYVLYYIFNIFFQKDVCIPKYKILLIYIATFSLTVFIRSFQRQTLAVLGYNPFLFVFLILSLPIFVSKRTTAITILIFIFGLLAYQFILPNSALLLKNSQQVTLYNWHSKESRVRLNDNGLEKIVSFINSNLEPQQTFLDLSSSPLLYVVTNRKFTGYFIPSAYYTSDTIQTNELARITSAYIKSEIPILIFRQPNADANNIDGVPNEIRSYKIYEFVNTNYHPVGTVIGYSVWVSNGFKLKDSTNLIQNTDVYEKFDLQMLPYIWGTYDTRHATNNTKILASILDNPLDITSKTTTLDIPRNLDKTSGNYIHFKITGKTPGVVTVNYGQNPISQFTFDLIQSQRAEDYLVRISSQYYWSIKDIDKINITSSVPVTIDQILVRKGD